MAAPKPKGSYGGSWSPIDLSYAVTLQRRGLLENNRVARRDPTCRECGHRALDHGLRSHEQERWFSEEALACQWKGCGCQVWRPYQWYRHPAETVGLVRVEEAWVEVPLGQSWIVAYRIVNDHGTPAVGELRVFPAEEDRPGLGQWSGDALGTRAKVPRRGITTRQLRAVRVRAYQRYMADEIARLRDASSEIAHILGWDYSSIQEPERTIGTRRGRKGRPDEFYARVAAEYARAVARGSRHPITDITRRRGFPIGQVRDMVRQARKRGLLTLTAPGVRGGVLTERARALLQARKRQT